MSISKEGIEKLKTIYRDAMEEKLTDEEAIEIGNRVTGLLRILMQPLPH